MKPSSIASFFVSALCFQSTTAFVDMAMPLPVAPSKIAPEAVFGDAMSAFAESPLASSTLQMANAFALPVQSVMMPPPQVESQFLGDISMALDLSQLFRPNKKTMRVISLGGRLLGLMADYVPDHSIHAEELLVQLFFMGTAVKEILDEEFQFTF